MKFIVLTLFLACLSLTYGRRRPFLRNLSLKQRKPDQPVYNYETLWYNQTLDHFTFTTQKKFRQKYLLNKSHWSEGEPIFFYTGNEGFIESFAENSGFMWDIAPEFRAMLVFAEHRFYGESLPFGHGQVKNASQTGYLTSEQALADYVELITYLKETIPGAENSQVFAFGGSYGGMLAAWIRMKYPHVVKGAIAASAPVAQFTTPCDAFGRIVTSDYSAAVPNETCANAIRKSWAAFDRMGKKANNTGIDWINKNWKLCNKFTHKDNITLLKDYLNDLWTDLAMMDYPYPTSFLAPLPANPVSAACQSLKDEVYKTDEELLTHVFKAASVYFNTTKTSKCLNITNADDIGADMWGYQACSEMIMPFCYDGVNDMFEAQKWDITQFSKDCEAEWGVTPNPNMANLMYGGRNVDAASNIVFSNGLLDPWSSGGVLKTNNKSKTIVTLIIPEGAHHLDLRSHTLADPQSVLEAREAEVDALQSWIHDVAPKGADYKLRRVRGHRVRTQLMDNNIPQL